jgi:acetyltransferase-like isoleucine patch superfamily enzyme
MDNLVTIEGISYDKQKSIVSLPNRRVRNSILKRLVIKYSERYMPSTYAKLMGVKFGDHCRFIGRNQFGSEPYLINLGDYVSITSSTFITHDGGVWVFRNEEPDIDVVRPIIIGNNVFIGINCTILPGVKIGDNTVIGAGSIITKELPGGFVYAGNPAKPIKTIQEYRAKVNILKVNTKKMSDTEKESFFKEKLIQN